MKGRLFLSSLVVSMSVACATPQDRALDSFLNDVPTSTNESAERFLGQSVFDDAQSDLYSIPVTAEPNAYGPSVDIGNKPSGNLIPTSTPTAEYDGTGAAITAPKGSLYTDRGIRLRVVE